MKILIASPEMHRLGGVANHYLGLHDHWSCKVEYSFYGKRNDKEYSLITIMSYPVDFVRYLWKLMFRRPDVVIVNPSFRTAQLIRDGIYLLTARALKIPVVTFIHGFDLELSDRANRCFKGFVSWAYSKSMFIYVLSNEFKRVLERWNVAAPVLLTSTKVSESLLDGFVFRPKNRIRTLLFVARIIKDKGIYEAIDAFRMVREKYPYVRLIVAGDGSELPAVKEYVFAEKITGVEFKGNVSGASLASCYQEGDVYLLPTRSEGMATSVLEAMAFGLPVITAPVGGIVDFFQNGKNGYLIDSYEPEKYAGIVMFLMRSPDLVSNISKRNHLYAMDNFVASKVADKFETDIYRYLKKDKR